MDNDFIPMVDMKINEMFWTFQGEGYNSGRRSLFVRLPDCNLNCSWCDTEWKTFKEYSEQYFIEFALNESSRFAVITGGEPLMNQQFGWIRRVLESMGFEIAVETNGTMPYKQGIDWVTCSPKRDAAFKVHRNLIPYVNEYKYVVDKEFDFKILERHKENKFISNRGKVKLYLSPEFNNLKENLNKIFDYIKENPQWRISLQTHKWMGVR